MKQQALKVAELIKKGNVTIFSGAGLSTESGLMDFRSKDGIWNHVDPAVMASVGVLENRYDEFLAFYKDRLYVPNTIKPNIGHELIAKWEHDGLVNGIITQNIDGLHQKAGAVNVAELHGGQEPVKCCNCGKVNTIQNFLDNIPCECGGHLRTDIVLFGEMLPEEALAQADNWSYKCNTFIVLGSSLAVSPANYFPRKAKMAGASLVIINRDETAMDYMADIVIHKNIGDFLREVERSI